MKRIQLKVAHFATLSRYSLPLYQLLSSKLDTSYVFIDNEQSRALATEAQLPVKAFYPEHAFLAYRHAVSPRLLQEALARDYDVWLGGGLFSFPVHACLPLVRATRRPYVFHSEDWWWPDGLDVKLAKPVLTRLPRLANARVAASTNTLQFLLHNGAPEQGTFLALDATDDLARRPLLEDVLAKMTTELGVSGKLVLLYLNRVVYYKGLDVLLRALDKCRDLRGIVELLIVGDGPFLDECRQLATRLRLENVRFAGPCDADQSQYFYRMADVYVHPCRFAEHTRVKAEAWGFTINEAMSMSLPIIATDAVASAIDLVDETSGRLVAAGDVDALAVAIRWATGNRDRLRPMGEAARSRVMNLCTPQLQYEGVAEAIRFALASRKSPA